MEKQLEDLKAIREMMEKSTKFLSLSGMSGILAGATAICGAAFAYFYLLRDPSATDYNRFQETMIMLADAMLVLILSLSYAFYFSWKKARKSKQKIFNNVTYKLLYHLAIPLLSGGIFSLIFLLRGDVEMVASATLLFYGLALVNVSKFTYNEIHYLGITEIILGLLAAIFMHNGIIFWTIGFGLCHIIYGFAMYRKYDLKK
ncbi:MAG: hypothetical protein H6Q20_1711 [Bacteroidetes bacterium]|nr:hypothetical protein [Bacteroidota bacterium]